MHLAVQGSFVDDAADVLYRDYFEHLHLARGWIDLDFSGLRAEGIGGRVVAVAGLGIGVGVVQMVVTVDLERADDGRDLGPAQMFSRVDSHAVVDKAQIAPCDAAVCGQVFAHLRHELV